MNTKGHVDAGMGKIIMSRLEIFRLKWAKPKYLFEFLS